MKLSTFIKRHELMFVITLTLLVSGVFIFLRSSYVSGLIGVYVSESVNASSGLHLGAGNFYINPFPLFVGAQDIDLTDSEGHKVASFRKAKAYISLTSLFTGKPRSHRVVLERPEVEYTADLPVKLPPGENKPRNGKPYAWAGVLIIRNGSLSYRPESGIAPLRVEGIDAEISFREAIWVLFSIDSFRYDIRGEKWPEINPSFKGRLKYSDSGLEIDALTAYIDESYFRVGGEIRNFGTTEIDGDLDINLLLKVKSLEGPFALKNNTEGELRSKGSLRLGNSIETTELDITIGGDFHLDTLLEALRADGDKQEQFTGHIRCDGSLGGPLNKLKGSATAGISRSNIHGIGIDSAKALVSYDDGRIDISEGRASLYGGKADVNVSFNVLRHEPFSLAVDFSDVDSNPVFDRIHIGNIGLPAGKLRGEFLTDGMRFAPRGWARFKGGITREDTPLGRMNYFSGHFHTREGVLVLEDFDLRSGHTQVSFDGNIDLNGDSIDFDGYAITTDISDVLAPLDYGFRAGGKVDVKVRGTNKDPLVSLKAALWESYFRGYRLGELTVIADYKKDILVIKQLDAWAQDTHHVASGTIMFPAAKSLFDMAHPSFDLKATAASADLGGMIAIFADGIDISGIVNTSTELTGTFDNPVLEGHASLSGVNAYKRVIDSGTFDYYLKGKALGIKNSEFTRSGSRLYLDGEWHFDGYYDMKMATEGALLSHLVPEVENADFKVDMTVSGKGMFNDPVIELKASLLDGNFMNVPAGKGQLSASLVKGQAIASLVLMDGNLTATGKAGIRGKRPWSLDIALEYDRYDHVLRSLTDKLPADIVLAMDGNIGLRGDNEHVYSTVRLARANVTLYGQGFANIGPFEVDAADRLITFRHVSMRGAHVSFDLLGSMNLDRSFDLAVRADASLLPFAKYTHAVSYLKGDAKANFSMKGPWESPDITGRMEVSGASVGFRRMPQRITSINGAVSLSKGRAVVEQASAKVGAGDLEITGNIDYDGFSVKRVNIETTIRNVSARLSDHFNAKFDGFLLFAGDAEKQDLNGELHVLKASYRERVDWRRALLGGGAESPKIYATFADNVRLNIRLYGYENIRIDNNLAIAPIKADLFVRGTLASPALLGRVEAIGGKVFFRNSELNIVASSVDFSDLEPGRPVIGVTATANVKGYDIWLNMQGHADKMDLELSSEPPLDENEILALLTYGDLSSGYGALESGLGTAEATYLLTGEFQELMEERLTIFTGLDRFRIDPYLSRSTGSVKPRITVAKKLLDDKLYLTYASTLDVASEDEIKLEYLLGDNVSVIGGQDYTGSVGGDLKFRFRFE